MSEPDPSNLLTIDATVCVNRRGLAEMAGRSLAWVNLAATRPECSSYPRPLARRRAPGRTGRGEEWYPLDAARAWVDQLAAAAPTPQRVPEPDDPDEPIGPAQFREIMRPTPAPDTMKKYVRQLRRDLAAGKRSFLPPPTTWVQTSRGLSPRWPRGAAVAWQNNRPGQGGRPTGAAYRPMPAPEPDDPDELIGENRFRTEVIQPPMSQLTWKRLIAESVTDWQAGRDGALPRPDATDHIEARGKPTTVYRWRAGKAAAWQNQRAALVSGEEQLPERD